MNQTYSRTLPAVAIGLAGVAVGGLLVRWVRSRLDESEGEAEAEVTILAPLDQVWEAWAPLVTLPQFMKHVDHIENLGDGRSRWTAHLAEGGPPVVWEAVETTRVERSVIRWQTIEGQPLHQNGEVRFEAEPYGGGTIVRLRLGFQPGESLVQLAASFMQRIPEQIAQDELERFKTYVESGRIPLDASGQPGGGEKRAFGDLPELNDLSELKVDPLLLS